MLFTLIAERYERRSLGITSNLVFSEWAKVFANCDDTLGPSGTGSDPFANWLRCPHRDLRFVPGVAKALEASVSSDLIGA